MSRSPVISIAHRVNDRYNCIIVINTVNRQANMKLIDYQNPRPIYIQICDKLKMLILKGVLAPDEQLPSVRALAMENSINPNTIQRAYSELERQGFIYTVKGKGNFVRGDVSLIDQRKEEIAQKIAKLITEAEELGISRDEIIGKASQYQ